MSLHLRRRPAPTQWVTVAWLTLVWVLLWGDLSVGNVLAGILVGLAVAVVFPLPAIASGARVRPLGVARLLLHFARDLVVASVQVSIQAFRRRPPVSAVIGVRLRSSSDLFLTLTAEFCSLVPGSIVVEAHRLTGTLYLHVLDVDTAGGVEAARQSVLDQEERVLRAFASKAQLAAVGLGTGRPAAGRPAPAGPRGSSA